jgi:signal transduction histidine kinase
VRRRLGLAIAGVAAAAVVLFAVPLAVVLGRSYRVEELLKLQRDAVAATRQIDLTSSSKDTIELPPAGTDQLAVYDPSGRRVAGTGPSTADDAVRAALRSGKPSDRTADGKLVAAAPLILNERVSGALRLARSDGAVARRTRDVWLALGALALALVIAAALVAIPIGRLLARPLERLAVAARRLGDGDFTVRAPRAGVAEVDGVAEALDATAERLDDLVARERSFSTDASHQLRTPIAALRLELEAMQLGGDRGPELDAALAQVDRLQATVDTLLAVARGGPRPHGEADLAALLDDVDGRWRGTLAAEGRPLRTAARVTPATAAASPRVVAEIVEVLLANAHRHGGGAVSVTVREVEGWLAVDVADEGPGFGDASAKSFGERSDSEPGHGIGLGLASSLAEAEGGRLILSRARPRPVVTLLLPRRDHGA